jgi:hypothetical protein
MARPHSAIYCRARLFRQMRQPPIRSVSASDRFFGAIRPSGLLGVANGEATDRAREPRNGQIDRRSPHLGHPCDRMVGTTLPKLKPAIIGFSGKGTRSRPFCR